MFEVSVEQMERINIIPRKVKYIGPTILSAYKVEAVRMCNTTTDDTSEIR